MSPSDPLEQAADQAVAEEIGGLANGIQSPMTIHIPDWIFCMFGSAHAMKIKTSRIADPKPAQF